MYQTVPFDQRLLVVVATYNEIDNLPKLVADLYARLPNATVLVIDDNSPDGTGDWCDQNSGNFPLLHCIHRSGKLGLGSATVAGFSWALERDFDLVATMDADFSHDPAMLTSLVAAMENDNSENLAVVIGSRYVPGGSIVGWPVFRRLASRAVNRFARFWLRLPTRDNSGAFRVYRIDALKTIDVTRLRSKSYSYLEEILWRLNKAGYVFREIPIVFRDRELGQSKTDLLLGLRVFLEIFQMGLGWAAWREPRSQKK